MTARSIQLASLVDATEAEGPGLRFAIWTQGCPLRCAGCCNPHLWSGEGGVGWSVEDLFARIEAARARRPELEGITLIGGEPFEQDIALAELASLCRGSGLTVMAFSGYTIEQLRDRSSALLAEVDLLVDGLYVEELRTTTRRWIGSTNQRMHFLSDAYGPDDPRFAQPNHAEIRMTERGEIQVVGFPFESVQGAFGPRSGLSRRRPAKEAS